MNHSENEDYGEGKYSYFGSYDAGDDESEQLTPLYHPRQRLKESSDNSKNNNNASFFTRIKQNLSSSPIAHLLGHQSRGSDSDGNVAPDTNGCPTNKRSMGSPTPAKNASNPSPSFNSHSRSCTASSTNSGSSLSSHFSSSGISTQYPLVPTTSSDGLGNFSPADLSSPTLTMSSAPDDTPPVTPQMMTEESDPHPDVVNPNNVHKRTASIRIRDDDTHEDVKKGKQPALPFPYETLIADISGPEEPQLRLQNDINVPEDNTEWWGLEYTIELSRKDSRASDTSEETSGEHSKSRESWAAIHQGTVPFVSEDEKFHEWEKWRKSLDSVEMKKRKRRTIEFVGECDRLANIFVQEMQARRALELYEEILTDDDIVNVLMWIEYTTEQRQDPFQPSENHDLGWVLKNHRSIASLRDFEVSSMV